MSSTDSHATPDRPGGWASRVLCRLAWALLVAGSVRMLWLVLERPVLGYADNYDFVRMHTAFDLWATDAARGYGYPPAPLRRLAFAHFGRDGCLYSSEMLLIGPVVGLMRAVDWIGPGTQFDLRSIGFCQALVLILVSAWYCRRFLVAGHLGAALLLGVAFALLATDPINTLYLNSLYTDTAAWVFAWFAVLACAHLALEGPSAGRLVVWSLALVLLGTSKVQHVATAFTLGGCLLAAMWIAGRRFPRGSAVALAAAGAVMLVATWLNMSRADGYLTNLARCNITNTLMGGVLPLSKQPDRAVATLGLPPAAVQYIGKSAYDIPSPHPCPEIFTVPRTRLLRLFWQEPRLLWRMVRKGLAVIGTEPGGLRYSSVGCVEGAAFAVPSAWTLNRWYQPLSPRQRRAVVMFPLLMMLFYGLRAWKNHGRTDRPGVAVIVAACGVAAYASLGLTILGDGYSDYVRHNHVALNLLLGVNLMAAGHFAWGIVRRTVLRTPDAACTQPQTSWPRTAVVATGCALLFLVVNAGLVLAFCEPSAHRAWDPTKVRQGGGLCGRVEGRVPSAGNQVRLFGWAYDPVSKAHAQQLVVVCDGRALPSPVFRGLPRKDVTQTIGLAQLETCGWETVVSQRLAPDSGRLEVFAMFQDGSYGRLDGP